MFLVTGAAGFIGSNVVASLNEAGRNDIVISDVLRSEGKWRNLAGRQLADFVPPADLVRWLDGRKLEAVVHLGAISSTTASDGDLVIEANFRLPSRAYKSVHRYVALFKYSDSAVKAMTENPQDRSAQGAKLAESFGGKLVAAFFFPRRGRI